MAKVIVHEGYMPDAPKFQIVDADSGEVVDQFNGTLLDAHEVATRFVLERGPMIVFVVRNEVAHEVCRYTLID